MFKRLLHVALFVAQSIAVPANQKASKDPLRVETFVHNDVSLNMVSSLIIGSEAAVLIDLPLTISSATSLNAWIKTKTDKPIVAAFASHNHPDHYLGARTFFEAFPNTTFYANPDASSGIAIGAPITSAYWSSLIGPSDIVQNVTVPTPFPFTFFALPGDHDHPIHLIQPLTGDTVDETIFWLPTSRTLITGDAVYSSKLHLFMADMLTPALTASWISTLDLLAALNPAVVIPGHSLTRNSFKGTGDLRATREYLDFWQREVEAKGVDHYTPQEIYEILQKRFPGRRGSTSDLMLNITAENFGKGGNRFGHFLDLTIYDSEEALDGWKL
ncbi:metallo-beta-lactamase domain protein [Stagonosporopsis vannaccii]|nr:metallo-beta-lactamase domain protein [Stagonosporopsis vannaccii]